MIRNTIPGVQSPLKHTMTKITQIQLNQFRNIQQAHCRLAPGLNLFIGDNAAGKTSLIEALWLLASGRSFRASKTQNLIQLNQPQTTVFVETQSQQHHRKHRLAVQKSSQQTLLRLDGQTIQGQSRLAPYLPLQLLTPESHKLLEEGPKARRNFMDWGCFHQNSAFIDFWRHYQRSLKQRNSALKKKMPPKMIQLWDSQLIENALQIDSMRRNYLQQLTPYLQEFCQALMPELGEEVACHYRAGWPKNTENLADLMQQNLFKDQQLGHTQYGAHRADIRFRFAGQEAMQILSRGQQKLFVCALLLAQAKLHQQVCGEPVVMLIDDLPAELDENHRLKLLELLQHLHIQHLITSTAKNLIPILNPETSKCWQIEHGQIQELRD